MKSGQSGDLGFGWSLGATVDFAVSANNDVTLTIGGQRRTFYFTPQAISWLLPFLVVPAYTPEAGMHGTLATTGDNCGGILERVQGTIVCDFGLTGTRYQAAGYIYTDTSGTQYTIGADGTLESIQDLAGNTLTIGANGITSSTGLNVPFLRDTQGRITLITDPQGNKYQYAYDPNGNLSTVTYPALPQQPNPQYAYAYDTTHRLTGGTDPNGNQLPTTQYDASGRVQSVSETVLDYLGNATTYTTSYAYDLTNNSTTITYPADANGNVGTATMVYDSYGMLLSTTDPLGHKTTNTYDASHNLTSTTDPLLHSTSFTYDPNGNRTSVTYPQPQSGGSLNTTSYTQYNQFSEQTQTTDELGNIRSFNYDVNFNPQSVTDSLGTLASFVFNTDGTMQLGAVGYDISAQPSKESSFTYDANGNLASRTDALGRVTSYTYDSLGHKMSMTAPPQNTGQAGATTNYQFDPFGNLTETDAPLGRTTKSAYDNNGNKISDTDANGYITQYRYDALNRLYETDYPDGTKARKSYDFRSNVIDEIDQAGNATHHVYDLAGRLTSVSRAFGAANATTTSYTYDDDGRKLSETDNAGHATNYSYDNAGNLTGISGAGGTFTYGYDAARNRTSVSDGRGDKTTSVYDARKRLVEVDYPDQTKTLNAYDGPGNLTQVTDQNGNAVQYTYDAANQLKSVIQVNSPNAPQNTTVFGYDGDGNPISVEDANSHLTASNFDLLGELVQKTLPDQTLVEKRSYDPAGNLQTITHFNGVVTTYSYDKLNRLLSRSTPGEAVVSFTYTATGKYATSTDASGTTIYSYDGMDRLTKKQTPEGTLNYTYDAAGNVASIQSSNANGVNVSYTYDTLNRLSTVADSRSGTTTYTYDNANNAATVMYPNGIQTVYAYDQINRLTGLNSSQLGPYTYTLDNTGKKTNALEPSNRSITWSYDGINRLRNEAVANAPSGNNGNVAYGLDPVGNRLTQNSSLAGIRSGTFGYNADDQLSTESYDQNGNTISTGGDTFSYDSENHLVSMNNGAVQMVYDGDGNRVAKNAGGVVTQYLVDDLNPTGLPQVAEELVNGARQRTYTYGLNRISQNQFTNNAWSSSFYGYDGGGSVRMLTDPTGTVTDTYDYDAFGNLLNSTGSTPNNYLYRGDQFDPDLGVYYLRARYYNPATGRFLSRDPEDGKPAYPRTLHRYLYASGDPVNALDPTGRDDVFEYTEISLGRTKRAAGIGACVAVLLRTLNYLFWDFGDYQTGIPHWNGPLGPLPLIATPRCLYYVVSSLF